MTNTLITGGSKGLSYETARRLIADGHQVYFGARDPERGKRATAELNALFLELEVADDASVATRGGTAGQIGQLDVLINNAGIVGPHSRLRI